MQRRFTLHTILFICLFTLLMAGCRPDPTATSDTVEPEPTAAEETATAEPTLRPTGQPTPRPTQTPAPITWPATLEAWPDEALDLDNFQPGDPLVVRFNQPMDPTSAADPLRFTPFVWGDVTWNDDYTTLTFTPDDDFRPNLNYTVRFDRNLLSASGLRIDFNENWRLHTMSAPQLTHHTPSGQKLTERQPTIRLLFNRPMDEASVLAALTISPTIAYEATWQSRELHLTFSEKMAFGTVYHFHLSQEAADTFGQHPAGDYRWSYELAGIMDTIGHPTFANRQLPITLRFNYAMNTATVAQAIRFEPALNGEWQWNENKTVATFTPDAPLTADATYTIHFEGTLRDTSGEELPLPEAITFTTPPPILAQRPSGSDIHPATAIAVTFDRPMNQPAAEAAFTIVPAVEGTFDWTETTLTFRTADAMAEYTTYTVTLSLEAVDADGNTILSRPYSWNFRTGQLTDIADFGYGPNAQLLDTNGRRAVQFTLYQRHANAVTFELYRLSLTQFLDRYSSGFRGWNEWERPLISTEGTTLFKTWSGGSGLNGDNGFVSELIVPADVPPGLYILNLRAGHVNDQLLLVLTSYNVAVKQAENQIFAWVTDVNGGPVAAAEVAIYARDGRLLTSGTADANGVYRTTVPTNPDSLIVVAGSGTDRTASGLTREWRSEGSYYGRWWETRPLSQDYSAYIYTERPIYRPGHLVYFKALIRQDDDAILSVLPAGTPVTARLRDARNNVVQTIELVANDFGTVNGQFQLAEGAMLGDYAIEISLAAVNGRDPGIYRQTFKVEDYRKPDYQVTVTTDATTYIDGDTIAVTIDTRYYFGEPVANATLSVQRYNLEPAYYWSNDPDDSSDDYRWYLNNNRPISGRTDENGLFTFTIQAESNGTSDSYYNRQSLQRTIWGIEVTVDDGSHQTVSGVAIVNIYNQAERLALNLDSHFQQPGEPFTIEATIADLLGQPIGERNLTLSLNRYNLATYRYDITVQSTSLTTNEDGRATVTFTINQPGYYRLRITGTDRLGHAIFYYTWLYAFRDGYWADWYGQGGDLRVTADRENYLPGDTAQLLIESSFSGPALLTFERGTTRREMLVELTAPVTVVEVTIQPDDAPNIFVVVNAWQAQDTTPHEEMYMTVADSQMYVAYTEVAVAVLGKELHVTITPDQESYAPRQNATFTVRVTNSEGVPVSAELSLAMVDEAIFALSDELSGPIFNGFYYRRGNIVATFDSMSPSRYLNYGGMGGGGGGDDYGSTPRSDFQDTAGWFPVLHTDANGEATVTLTLPDNLTSWRLTAKAITADTQVGEATANILVKQEIVVRPILPRTLTAGDTLLLSAAVHNYSTTPQTVAVTFAQGETPHLEILDALTQTITLAPGEVRLVGWQGTALSAGDAEIVVSALVDGRVEDAVQLPLTIRPLAIPDVTTQVGQFTGVFQTTVTLPADALEISHIRLELSRSIAGTLLEGLEYLTGFPYGCVEQTMSRALPNAVVGRAINQLGISNPTLQADLPPQINASVQRLYGFQHNDGGWGWWFDDNSHPYQTAWVIFGLVTTAEAGYEIDPAVIERGVVWLNDNYSDMDMRTRAFALYSMALAGQGDLLKTEALAEQAPALDAFSQAALALTLDQLGAPETANAVLDRLTENAITSTQGMVYWSGAEHDGYRDHKTMASDVRNTALALSAFTELRPDSDLIPGMVRWLMSQRQQYGWGTTNETAFTIIALTDHLLATSFSEGATATTYQVEVNGQVVASGNLDRGEPAVSLDIPAAQLRPGSNDIRITQSGAGRLYYVLSNRVYRPEEAITAAGEIAVSRVYLDPETGQQITSVQAGELVKVQVTVVMPTSGSYIIVEDNPPGGLEPLNERLNTTSQIAGAYSWQEPTYYWRDYGYNYKEVHGDRVSFFITEMGSGRHVFTYFARATHSGQFVAMPVELYAMYDLTNWGRSASSVLTVTPAAD
jgi:uncharacterized protein YfaS (alpha-2-macroglobulin family)